LTALGRLFGQQIPDCNTASAQASGRSVHVIGVLESAAPVGVAQASSSSNARSPAASATPVAHPVTAAQACGWFDEVNVRADAAIEHALPPLADVMRTLSEPQLAHLEHKYAESNEELAERFLQRKPDKRRKAQLERAVDRIEMAYDGQTLQGPGRRRPHAGRASAACFKGACQCARFHGPHTVPLCFCCARPFGGGA
jgi:hypothetical protein